MASAAVFIRGDNDMDRFIRSLIEMLERLEQMDKEKLVKELGEFSFFIKKQVFSQIPSVSTIGGIVAGAWVSSTFTTSPIKAKLASWGLMKGGTHVVSSTTYRFLSIILPILTAALTVYLIQKILKTYREKQLQMHMEKVAGLGEEVQAEVRERLTLLERAKATELLSTAEYETKKANLFRTYSRTTTKIEELVIGKLTN